MWRGRHSGVSAKQPCWRDRSGQRLRSIEGDEQRDATWPGRPYDLQALGSEA